MIWGNIVRTNLSYIIVFIDISVPIVAGPTDIRHD